MRKRRKAKSGLRHSCHNSDGFHHKENEDTLRRVSLAQGRLRKTEKIINLDKGTIPVNTTRAFDLLLRSAFCVPGPVF